jgi:hypothetical protein
MDLELWISEYGGLAGNPWIFVYGGEAGNVRSNIARRGRAVAQNRRSPFRARAAESTTEAKIRVRSHFHWKCEKPQESRFSPEKRICAGVAVIATDAGSMGFTGPPVFTLFGFIPESSFRVEWGHA